MPEPQTPWRDDGVTIAACAAFGSAFDRRGRGRFCSLLLGRAEKYLFRGPFVCDRRSSHRMAERRSGSPAL